MIWLYFPPINRGRLEISQAKFKEEARIEIMKLKEILAKRAKDPEVEALEAQLRQIEGEVSERQQMCGILERRLEEAQMPDPASKAAPVVKKSAAKKKSKKK